MSYVMLGAYTLIIFAVIYFAQKRTRNKQGQKTQVAGNPASGEKKVYTKEQQAVVKEQYKAYRETVYRDYPQVDKFETVKRRWIGFLLLSGLLLFVAKAWLIRESTGASFMALVFSVVMAFGVNAIFLLCAMGPKWKLSCFLYLMALKDIATYGNTLFIQGGIDSWEKFSWVYIEGFREYPFAVSLDFLSWIYTLLVLGTAIWLTLVPKNRELAEQSEVLQNQLKSFTPTV